MNPNVKEIYIRLSKKRLSLKEIAVLQYWVDGRYTWQKEKYE